MMSELNIEMERYIIFKTPIMNQIMDWAVENIFKKIWTDEKWSKCAKGGKNEKKPIFESHRDMAYQVHIFSGCAMAMKVLDYEYHIQKHKYPDDLERKLKRAVLSFLFHDFNKITESNYLMTDKTPLFEFVDETFSELSQSVGLTHDEIYQVVICTEAGTTFNVLSNENVITNLDFEMNFSKLSDKLSGIFNDRTEGYHSDLKFGPSLIVSGKNIRELKFASTNLVAITDVLKEVCVDVIERSSNMYYLWSDYETIYFVCQEDIDKKALGEDICKNFKKSVFSKLHAENMLRMNDRRVDNSAQGFVQHTELSLSSFVKDDDKFKMCLHLEDVKLDTEQKIKIAEKMGDFLRDYYPTKSFNFNFRFAKSKEGGMSVRDGLNIFPFEQEDKDHHDERIRIFLCRYIQLVGKFKSTEADKIRMAIETIVREHSNMLVDLVGKEPKKSTIIFPILLKELQDKVDWEKLLNDVIKDLNKVTKSIDYENIISKILPSLFDLGKLPEVPSKFSMSMSNGYPAKEDGKGDKLYGLNTNGFNNRLPTAKIGNGKIDDISIFEYNLRRSKIRRKKGEETLIYLKFPGSIPHLNLDGLINKISSYNTVSKDVINFLDLDITGEGEGIVRVDNSIFISTMQLNGEKDVLEVLYKVLELAHFSKLMVKVSYSNAPIFEDQFESIKFDISSTILSHFSWEKIRCNEILKVKKMIQTFNVVYNGSLEKINFEKTSLIILHYIQNPLSLFSYVHEYLFGEREKKLRGFGKQFSQRIDDIRKLGYVNEKKGGVKMKNIESLAMVSAKIQRPEWDMSGNQRTWMLRESLDALELARAKIQGGAKRDIVEFEDIVGGVINREMRSRTKGANNWIPVDAIREFAKQLTKLLKEDFGGQIPSGAMKSYFINAYEFEYMLTSKVTKDGELNE